MTRPEQPDDSNDETIREQQNGGRDRGFSGGRGFPGMGGGLDDWIRRAMDALPQLNDEQIASITKVVSNIDQARRRAEDQGKAGREPWAKATDEWTRRDR